MGMAVCDAVVSIGIAVLLVVDSIGVRDCGRDAVMLLPCYVMS